MYVCKLLLGEKNTIQPYLSKVRDKVEAKTFDNAPFSPLHCDAGGSATLTHVG